MSPSLESPHVQRQRQIHWYIFQGIFMSLYIGVVLDVITTMIGVAALGKAYEQNPIGVLITLRWIATG